ncbi:hypothetical protein GCM10010448_65940 [Streptomyces glomeratus]|uniref:Tetratricopeptide repeat protein n=1 Tax=Streptomyces glomeratus TaxID=284452 RepID=A0ABP6M2W2_9ACTN
MAEASDGSGRAGSASAIRLATSDGGYLCAVDHEYLGSEVNARLREAEAALSQADNRHDAIGGYDQAAYLFHVFHVLMEEGDLAGSIHAMKQSIRVQPAQERQGRVHAYAVLAQRQLRYGHLEAACDSWARFLDEYEHVSSVRGDGHFATIPDLGWVSPASAGEGNASLDRRRAAPEFVAPAR